MLLQKLYKFYTFFRLTNINSLWHGLKVKEIQINLETDYPVMKLAHPLVTKYMLFSKSDTCL